MRIKIRSADQRLALAFPTCLLNAWFLHLVLKDKISADEEDAIDEILPMVRKELKRLKKRDRHFVLVDVVSSDGDRVKITL